MSRFARAGRVFFVEEPVDHSGEPDLHVTVCPQSGVHIVTPRLDAGLSAGDQTERNAILERLLAEFAISRRIRKPIVWFYTPMALEFFPRSITPGIVVYDCMDELSLFKGAPAPIRRREEQLLGMADLVFTGGVSLFEAKRDFHPQVYPFPSGVDVGHFVRARDLPRDFGEMAGLPVPRLGYAGVIDERLDLALVEEVARKQPDWQIVMIGPTAKISPEALPRRANIHWLGMKSYADLPKYFAGWDVGIMPFALNDSTRFISPTKTPEYLSAGLPVVSTAIRDVERSYGELGLARIVHSADEFIAAAEQAIAFDMSLKWRERADEFLRTLSWDCVWGGMNDLINGALATRSVAPINSNVLASHSAGVTARV